MKRFMEACRIFWAVLTGRSFVAAEEVEARESQRLDAASAVPEDTAAEAPPDRFAEGAVYALVLLQREGRLVDFLREDIDGYSDEDIGRAVRRIHAGCSRILTESFGISPVIDKDEGTRVELDADFDASAVKLTGSVPPGPPYGGTLQHKGWKAAQLHFPERTGAVNICVVQPAEVEI